MVFRGLHYMCGAGPGDVLWAHALLEIHPTFALALKACAPAL